MPASTGNNRATCVTLGENVTCATLQRYGKMLNGQTLKSATSNYDQRHVIAFRPISVAARSWSYDKYNCCIVVCPTTCQFLLMAVQHCQQHNSIYGSIGEIIFCIVLALFLSFCGIFASCHIYRMINFCAVDLML